MKINYLKIEKINSISFVVCNKPKVNMMQKNHQQPQEEFAKVLEKVMNKIGNEK